MTTARCRAGAGLCVALLLLCLAGCGRTPASAELGPSQFALRDLVKSDIDGVAELTNAEVRRLLRDLTAKLYRRNPRELAKGDEQASRDGRLASLFDGSAPRRLPQLHGCRTTQCIILGLDPAYAGDRVYAFAFGMLSMVDAAFDNRREFFVLDDLDPQKLYNCARNFEIAAWKLSRARDGDGVPLLLSNSMSSPPNLSFERLFGKLIALQDMLARVIAGKQNRTIKFVVLRLMTAIFLPI